MCVFTSEIGSQTKLKILIIFQYDHVKVKSINIKSMEKESKVVVGEFLLYYLRYHICFHFRYVPGQEHFTDVKGEPPVKQN